MILDSGPRLPGPPPAPRPQLCTTQGGPDAPGSGCAAREPGPGSSPDAVWGGPRLAASWGGRRAQRAAAAQTGGEGRVGTGCQEEVALTSSGSRGGRGSRRGGAAGRRGAGAGGWGRGMLGPSGAPSPSPAASAPAPAGPGRATPPPSICTRSWGDRLFGQIGGGGREGEWVGVGTDRPPVSPGAERAAPAPPRPLSPGPAPTGPAPSSPALGPGRLPPPPGWRFPFPPRGARRRPGPGEWRERGEKGRNGGESAS